LHVAEFHLRLAFLLEVLDLGFDDGVEILNLLDLLRLDSAVELVLLIEKLHFHRHERLAIYRHGEVVEFDRLGLFRDVLENIEFIRSLYELVRIFFKAPALNILV
jgi:hypothetical protein